MQNLYEIWLRNQGYDEGTIRTQLYRVARIEACHGSLDAQFDDDGLASLMEVLTYSSADQRNGRPNPSRIPFSGNTRNNLASYKSSVIWYRRFREHRDLERTDRQPLSRRRERAAAAVSKVDIDVNAKTLLDFRLDGRLALKKLVASSQYQTLEQAVASLTLFTHPETVRQTGGRALFPSIRNARRVGDIDDHHGQRVLLDDNKSPKDAFLWSNGLSRRGPDTQFNHIYANSLDVEAYTALPNICMTPAFIAKLTDTSPAIRRLLQYRSFDLYNWIPASHSAPDRPAEYESLEWAPPLPPVEDIRSAIGRAMATKPKDRTVMAAKELGWLFD